MRGVRFVAVSASLLAGCGSGGGAPPGAADGSAFEAATGEASADVSSPDVPEASRDVADASPPESSAPQDGSAAQDGSTAPFADPNPLPCVGMDPSALCLMGWPDTAHTFTGCCLTAFPQNPQGKCGVSSGSSPCFERKAPGNPDPTCQGGNFDVCFGQGLTCAGGFRVGGRGVPGCCQWRTGTCGVAAGDLGCIDHAETSFQGMPCTPDYANGSQYP
jgi:hypothetical protein